jgi:O-antigen ligase
LIGLSVAAVGAIVGRRFTRGSALLMAGAAVELQLAQHRSGFAASAVALLATASFLGGSQQSLRRLLKLLVFAAIALAGYLLTGGSFLDETMERLRHTTDLQDGNIAWRLLSWYEVLDGVIDQPLGHGFRTWEFWFTASDPLTGSHNDYLDLAYRVGVPGLVAFLALPVSLIRQTRQLVQRTGPLPQILPITVCAAILALLVFASLNVVLESPQLSILFWVLLGLGAGVLHDRRE